jgi:predicted nucleic acid-binding protein
MRKVLLDLSVVLDLLLNRSPWAADAAAIWDAHVKGQLQVFLAAFSLSTIFYIVRRQTDLAAAQKAVDVCLANLDIVPVDRATLGIARTLPGSDFEDNLQIACALQVGADVIVTRDPKGFSGSPISVLTPTELRNQLAGPPTP